MSDVLQRFSTHVDAIDRQRIIESGEAAPVSETVWRRGPGAIDLRTLDDLAADFRDRRRQWEKDRAKSDQWLAPRLHYSLRLNRTLASDPQVWHWLSVTRWADYVTWRWGESSVVADNRWVGPVNKQALARLWWTAELFRNGSDYRPVESAFVNQDLVNSYLHRPIVRCRSFALGLVDVLASDSGGKLTSKKVNDLARVLNLCTAGAPPEVKVGFQTDDVSTADAWSRTDAAPPTSWDERPMGPEAADTTDESVRLGGELAAHGMLLAYPTP